MIMKIKITLPLSLLLTAFVFTGCSSGTSNPPQTQQQAPQGPISYVGIQSKFAESTPVTNATLTLGNKSSGCGSVMTRDGFGSITASNFLTLIPEAGTALGIISNIVGGSLTLAGANGANACITNEFNILEGQLVTQQNEINNIQTVLALTDNSIWAAINQNADNVYNGNYTQFSNSIAYFNESGRVGLFYQAYEQAGLYDNASGQLTSETLNQLAGSKPNLQALNTLLNKYVGGPNATEYYQQLTNITGTSFPTGSCTDCYESVSKNLNTTYINLLTSASQALNTNMTNALHVNPNKNLIPMLDDYNNTIVSYYLQSMYALQAAYHILYLTNYLNYNQSTLGTIYLPDVLGVPGTYYSASTNGMFGTKNAAYNSAQKSLTLFFAALVNQTYQNTISYIVTDAPVGVQVYPDTQQIQYINESGQTESGGVINYSQLVGSALNIDSATPYLYAALNAYASTSMVGSYSALETNLESLNFINYQYGGLRNVATCIQSINSYNESYGTNGTIESALANPAACPSILADINGDWVNQSVFNGNTIQPYYESTTQQLPALTGAVTNNINPLACNYNSVGSTGNVINPWSMYLYTPQSDLPSLGITGQSYLMCGNWQTTNVSNYNNKNILFYLPEYMANMLTTTTDYNSGTGITFYSPTTLMTYDMSGIWSTTFGTYTAVSAGQVLDYNQGGSGSLGLNGLVSGWINDNFPDFNSTNQNDASVMHVVAVQTTMPDGFIAPYGIAISSTNPANNYGVRGFTIGISPNPNVINAGVTINGAPLYDLNHIESQPGIYDNVTQMINNYPWIPVTSTLPAMSAFGAAASFVSALGINGYLLTTVGSTNGGNGNPVICFADPAKLIGPNTNGSTINGAPNDYAYVNSIHTGCFSTN